MQEFLDFFQRNWRQLEKQVFLCCFISIFAKVLYNVCSVHRGVFSTLGGYHDECGGYLEYFGGCSVHRRDTMNTSGDIMSISVDVQYIGGIS